jgi:membrane protease YdiL (CAAX protease family)
VRALLAGVVILMASAAVVLGGVALLRPFWGPDLWRPGAGELVSLAAWQMATVVLTIMASAMLGGRAREVLALDTPAGTPLVYLTGLLLLAALQVPVTFVQYSLFRQDLYADLRPFVQLFGEQWLLALLVVGVGAPLSEELLFRGFLLSALARSRVGFGGGAVVSTALWTALHAGYSTAGIAEVFVIGLFFSWLVWRTGSLRVAIFCHALYNSLIVVMLRHVPLPA